MSRKERKGITRRLICPCGAVLEGESDDELVARAQAHLGERHPGRDYTREEILALAL